MADAILRLAARSAAPGTAEDRALDAAVAWAAEATRDYETFSYTRMAAFVARTGLPAGGIRGAYILAYLRPYFRRLGRRTYERRAGNWAEIADDDLAAILRPRDGLRPHDVFRAQTSDASDRARFMPELRGVVFADPADAAFDEVNMWGGWRVRPGDAARGAQVAEYLAAYFDRPGHILAWMRSVVCEPWARHAPLYVRSDPTVVVHVHNRVSDALTPLVRAVAEIIGPAHVAVDEDAGEYTSLAWFQEDSTRIRRATVLTGATLLVSSDEAFLTSGRNACVYIGACRTYAEPGFPSSADVLAHLIAPPPASDGGSDSDSDSDSDGGSGSDGDSDSGATLAEDVALSIVEWIGHRGSRRRVRSAVRRAIRLVRSE